VRKVGCALVHYPVLDREGRSVTSAITNIDLHDISRSALTFGLCGLWVTHPIDAQRTLAHRVRDHWVSGSGGRRIPDRIPALGQLRIVTSLEEAEAELGAGTERWTTSARVPDGTRAMSFAAGREALAGDGPPVLLVFGTGWGLAPEVHAGAAACLEPVLSPREDGYNHLSVRAAVAIILDRLLGVR
jgi:hypothetical protein